MQPIIELNIIQQSTTIKRKNTKYKELTNINAEYTFKNYRRNLTCNISTFVKLNVHR